MPDGYCRHSLKRSIIFNDNVPPTQGRLGHTRGKIVKKWTCLALLAAAAAPGAFAADSVTVQKPVTINDDADVPQAVLDECKLDSEVPDAVASTSKAVNSCQFMFPTL